MSPISAAIRQNDGTLHRARTADRTKPAVGSATRARAAALNYSIITTREAFNALAEDWDDLFARAGRGSQLFQTFNWCWHWCNHYLNETSKEQSLAIVAGWSGDRLVLVWPLVRVRAAGLVKLEALGAPVSQYSDALIEASPEAARQLREAWDAVVAAVKPDLAWLLRVREDAAIAPLMRELGALPAQRLEAPYIDLSETRDFDGYMARRSAQARKKRRAAERRLAGLDAKYLDPADGAAASTLAATAIDMKRRQLCERGLVSPAFGDHKMAAFFADAMGGGEHPAGASVIALQVDGECAAANILVGCNDRVAGHVFAYHGRFAKESVGSSLLHHSIKTAIASGYQTFDLLAPADDYKLRCADGTAGVVSWAVPLSTKGKVFARIYLMRVLPLLKAALKLTPEWLARFVARRYYGKAS